MREDMDPPISEIDVRRPPSLFRTPPQPIVDVLSTYMTEAELVAFDDIDPALANLDAGRSSSSPVVRRLGRGSARALVRA
jgi:hypothetical protein